MLHQQTHACNSNPAACAHDDRLAAGFDELHDVGVQTNGCHCQNDEELAQFFDVSKNGTEYVMHISRREDLIDHGCNDGRRYEI